MGFISNYTETYRQQFHFSPTSGWIGDVDGLIYFAGKYHLFWWGKATSTDLVHFDQVTLGDTFALTGEPGLGDYFTGGAVIDCNNTAGFGSNTFIPIYTLPTWPQVQGISYSLDQTLDTFNFYEHNPILAHSEEHDFRDPTVFWDDTRHQWLMSIALPVQRKIAFYSSPDMKNWTFLSDFGPIGAQEGVWECPDLFPLTLENGLQKWVLIVSMGPNKVQYFVGNFDGSSFKLDTSIENYLLHGIGMDGELFTSFDGNDYENWTVTGNAFGNAPSSDTSISLAANGFASSKVSGTEGTGTLTSPPFIIKKNTINFLLSGGCDPENLAIQLIVNGEVVRSTTGHNSDIFKWYGWDVTEFSDMQAFIRIIDNSKDTFGYINVDHIMFSDVLHNEKLEHALWADYGTDFYATRTVRDYEGTLKETSMLGWLGNWDYAREVPAIKVPGYKDQTGSWSLARNLGLIMDNGIPHLIQTPVKELQTIRNKKSEIEMVLPQGEFPLNIFHPDSNTYEINAVFSTETQNKFGFHLLTGENRLLTISYDTATSALYIDRTNCSEIDIPNFKRTMSIPLTPIDKKIKLHIFVDKSSIEIFANDGIKTISFLTFPAEKQIGIKLFSENKNATNMFFEGWTLNSIWPGHLQNSLVHVEHTDSRMLYSGKWSFTAQDNEDKCYYTTDDGKITLTFTGTSIDWYGLVGEDLGQASIYLDGKPESVLVDCYSPVRMRQKLFSKTQLTPGEHTLVIQALHQKNAKSSSTKIIHDVIVYMP